VPRASIDQADPADIRRQPHYERETLRAERADRCSRKDGSVQYTKSI